MLSMITPTRCRSAVICKIMGVPLKDEPAFHGWIHDFMVGTDLGPEAATEEGQARLQKGRESMAALNQYMGDLIQDYLKEPGEGLLSNLVNDKDGPDGPMPPKQATSNAILMFIAGHDSTVNTIAHCVLTLLRHPESLDLLREQQELIPKAIEEVLRLQSAVQFFSSPAARPRTSRSAAPSSRRDRRCTFSTARPTATRGDSSIRRNSISSVRTTSMSAGAVGVHSCVGGPLARLEVNVAVENFLRRVENPRLVVDPPPVSAEPGLPRPAASRGRVRPDHGLRAGNAIRTFQFVEWQQPGQLREAPGARAWARRRCWPRSAVRAPPPDLDLLEVPAGSRASRCPSPSGTRTRAGSNRWGPAQRVSRPAIPSSCTARGLWLVKMNCRQGMENYCQTPGKPSPGGLGGTDGGMAEYLRVPSTRYLIPLGDLDPRDAAPLTDAGLTSYHAVKRSVHLLGPGSTAVVIGAGGLGQMAIQILKALASATTVVAVDTSADKLEIAKTMGADEVLISGDDAVKRIKDITKAQGAELVLDLVGVNPTLTMAAEVSRVLGHLTIVGLGNAALPVSFNSPAKECSVASPFWGSIPELIEVVQLAQSGKITMLVEHFPLDRAAEAYHLLHGGKVQGRAVITPND